MAEDPIYPIWKAKSLERRIYDYFVSRNMHTLADTFAKEANFDPNDVRFSFEDVPLLPDLWSISMDKYSSRPGFNPFSTQASTCMPNAHPPVLPVPDPFSNQETTSTSKAHPPGLPVPESFINQPHQPNAHSLGLLEPDLLELLKYFFPELLDHNLDQSWETHPQQSSAQSNAHPPGLPKPDPHDVSSCSKKGT